MESFQIFFFFSSIQLMRFHLYDLVLTPPSSSSETQTEPETPQPPERGGAERRLVSSGQPEPLCFHIRGRETRGHGGQGEGSGGASEEGAGATAETAGGGQAQTFRETTSRPVRTRRMELAIKHLHKDGENLD